MVVDKTCEVSHVSDISGEPERVRLTPRITGGTWIKKVRSVIYSGFRVSGMGDSMDAEATPSEMAALSREH